ERRSQGDLDRVAADELTADDVARLRAATGGRQVDPSASLFGPGSISWRVDREATLLLGGGRALLLQVAHPLIAAGVAAHSRFRAEPLARLWRTLDLMLTIVFADARGALAAVRDIERVHARVRGRLAEAVGPFPAGTPYDAADPELLLWVHATLVDSALVVYERFIGPLAPPERARFWQESKVTARLLGVPDPHLPRTLDDFARWFAGVLASDVLAIGTPGREVAASILHPPLPVTLAPATALARFATVGLLPPVVRARYGLGWSATQERALSALALVVRRTLPVVPAIVRDMPHARRA
ncbi:MAG TPA: oxygenase MpaB family protein, partial [Candidatus Binatia bacterium]|nr:oxygenase MpaB family protein [Candidatus Binatia bacterium]